MEMMSHCRNAVIRDSFGHKGAFFLGELHYTENKFSLLSVRKDHFPRKVIPLYFQDFTMQYTESQSNMKQ